MTTENDPYKELFEKFDKEVNTMGMDDYGNHYVEYDKAIGFIHQNTYPKSEAIPKSVIEGMRRLGESCQVDVKCDCKGYNMCIDDLLDTTVKEKHEFPKPHFDEGCIKCGGFPNETCEPPEIPQFKGTWKQLDDLLDK